MLVKSAKGSLGGRLVFKRVLPFAGLSIPGSGLFIKIASIKFLDLLGARFLRLVVVQVVIRRKWLSDPSICVACLRDV